MISVSYMHAICKYILNQLKDFCLTCDNGEKTGKDIDKINILPWKKSKTFWWWTDTITWQIWEGKGNSASFDSKF